MPSQDARPFADDPSRVSVLLENLVTAAVMERHVDSSGRESYAFKEPIKGTSELLEELVRLKLLEKHTLAGVVPCFRLPIALPRRPRASGGGA